MRKPYNIILTVALLALPAMSAAQYAISDTIRAERVVVKSTQFGASYMNNLDTYLSGYNYTGGGLNIGHEVFRDARTGNYRWKYQILFNSRIGMTLQKGNMQIAGTIGCSWSGYHPFKPCKGLTLLAGVQIQAEGGALYVPGNGNNPASAKLRTALAASGMAIYHFPVSGNDWTARYQLDIPLAGVMFAPQFGQSYYEIFGLGHAKGVVAFAHPLNCPSWRHTLSIDIPLGTKKHSTTLRLAYTADLYQSDINDIRCHMYSHTISFGFVKTILKVKKENRIKAYSPY